VNRRTINHRTGRGIRRWNDFFPILVHGAEVAIGQMDQVLKLARL
jgi:hypothetical protein